MRLLLFAAVAFMLASPVAAQLAAPNSAGVTFAHVHINVSDVELHKKLWVEQFGGVLVQKSSLVTIRLKIQELRRRAEAALGDDFDIRAFHDTVLSGGALPLAVLETRVERWIASVKRPVSSE